MVTDRIYLARIDEKFFLDSDDSLCIIKNLIELTIFDFNDGFLRNKGFLDNEKVL